MLCSLEISSIKLIRPLILPHSKFQTWINRDKCFAPKYKQPLVQSSIRALFAHMTLAFTVLFLLAVWFSRFLPEYLIKFYLQHSRTRAFLSSSSIFFHIPLPNQFQGLKITLSSLAKTATPLLWYQFSVLVLY